MIENNTGLIYKIKLDHNYGYSFMQTISFLEIDPFAGRLIYGYNLYYSNEQKVDVDIDSINSKEFILGPMRLFKFPSDKNKNICKKINKTNVLAVNQIPDYKDINSTKIYNVFNWEELNTWFLVEKSKGKITQKAYNEIRHLELPFLNTIEAIITKVTMYWMIVNNVSLKNYYDLENEEFKTLFIDVINTYFPLNKAIEIIASNKL